jgi:Ala-tRNA(Pro) deacylase
MLVKKLKEFLDNQNIQYSIIYHSPANTAQRAAACAHIKGKDLAKTVMIKADDEMIMAVLPANYRIDFNKLRDALGVHAITLADEDEFSDLFPDCETGAMPPFGNLYYLNVIVEKSLTADTEIAFNGGSHTELVKMSYHDFETLVRPAVKEFCVKQR